MGKYNDSDQIVADEMVLREGIGNVPIWKRYALTIA